MQPAQAVGVLNFDLLCTVIDAWESKALSVRAAAGRAAPVGGGDGEPQAAALETWVAQACHGLFSALRCHNLLEQMMELHDYATQTRLETLVDKATARRQQALEPAFVADIKSLCKVSDANVESAFDLIFDRLRQPHSQVRLLALELCAELFQRSRTFRALLAARFPQFLELVVGFRLEAPLPAPAAAAAALRERALELVERWSADHGARYRQVALGHAYLKDTLKLRFPEVDARRAAAQAEQAAREARAAQAAQQRYARLLEEWPQQAQEWRSLVRQMDEAFGILEAQERQAAQPAAAGDDDGWEDVAPEAAAREVDGLSAYAVAAEPAEAPLPAPAGAAAAASDRDDGAGNDVVVETLEGLHKVLENTALPGVQAALRTLVRADVGAPGDPGHAQRERLLRSATQLKEDLTAAQQRYVAAQLDLVALVQARQRREQAELMGALFGTDSEDEAAEGQAGGQGRGGRNDSPPAPELPNPYASIRDPAAPRYNARQAPVTASRPSAANTVQASGASSRLPEAVRRALAAQAPVLPTGAYVHVWDSSSAPVYASGHALEVSNHWGPVDVHQELPVERLDELFMVPAADRPHQHRLRQHEGEPLPRQPQQRVPPGRTVLRRAPSQLDSGPPASAAPAPLSALASSSADPRARRAAERAYNDAVIAGGDGDAQLAQALHDSDLAGGGSGKKKRTATKAPARERLQKRLLSGRAAAAALHDSAHAESERQREKFANRWENK